MSLIYGLINFDTVNFKYDIQENLIEVLKWQNCNHIKIDEKHFKGGILVDKSLPYNEKDFLFKDIKHDLLVLVSGDVYNKLEICKLYNISNKNIGSAELVFRIYLLVGEGFITLLNGDFTICLVDGRDWKTFIFRDHLGVKPVAYSAINDNLIFCSDFMALSKVFSSTENFNDLYPLQELTRKNLWDYELTPNKQVAKVLPGHYILYTENRIEQKKYWYPEKIKINRKLKIQTAISDLHQILEDSVKIRSDQRFFASAHVSGGLDSGIVAALVRKEYENQRIFYGFSWSPDIIDSNCINVDERQLVSEISKFLEIEHRFSMVTTSDYIDCVSDWRCALNGFDDYKLRKDAKKLGINLIFSGWGGDEFLSTNEWGINSDLLFGLNWKIFFRKNSILKPKKLIGVFVYNILLPFLGIPYFTTSDIRYMKSIQKYLALAEIKKGKTKNHLLTWKSRQDVHLNALYNYHIPSRMEEWAICGSRMGIEYRYPLLDKRIIEYLLTIPSKIISKEKRFLMKELCKVYLPFNVITRTKLRDEARGILYSKVINESFNILVSNFDLYRKNPKLSFVNFDLLWKDIMDYKSHQVDYSKLPTNLRILFKIHDIHVITTNFLNYTYKKAYYAQVHSK